MIDGEERLFRVARRGGKNWYPKWPNVQSMGDTLESALACARLLATPGQRSWVTTSEAARCTAMAWELVERRVNAALNGEDEAWPWTRLRKHEPCLFLPDLFEQAQYVYWEDLSRYTNRLFLAIYRASERGEVNIVSTPFRLVSGRSGSVTIPLGDALRFAHDAKLYDLFKGPGTSYARLHLLSNMSNVGIARLRLSNHWTKAVTGVDELV